MAIQYIEKHFKVLSRNDTGETNSHQSGISIPKAVAGTRVFPQLGTGTLNPRVSITFYDETDRAWEFQYIYYNDVFFGKPSHQAHNEFRLTCVKEFIKEYKVRAGNQIWFGLDKNNVRRIGYVPQIDKTPAPAPNGTVVIKISKNWKTIKF